MRIAERIQQARLAVGLANQSEFARRIGVVAPTIYRWERDHVAPDIFNLYEIARVCRVSMEWLVSGEGVASGAELAAWLDTPRGRGTSPEARAFLAGLPLMGHQPSSLFYDLALVAFESGLTREEAASAAKATMVRR